MEPTAPDPQQDAPEQGGIDSGALDALGQALGKLRKEAIDGRAASHVEEVWLQDEEHYEGIDDANRNEEISAWQTRPVGQVEASARPTQSTIFLNITRPYCDAASARVSDMLQPTDDRAWEIKATPIPDLIDISQGKHPQYMQQTAMRQFATGPTGMPNTPQQQQQLAQTELQQATQVALQAIAKADAGAKKAQTQIEDWHIENQFHAEFRKMLEDCSRLGTGVLKGPVPEKKRTVAIKRIGNIAPGAPQGEQAGQGIALAIEEKIIPASRSVSPWNLFPDPSCGEDIHCGAYIWERDYFTHKQLAELKGLPGYIKDQIDECLTEGPIAAAKAPEKREPDGTTRDYSKQFEVWYFHGTLKREELDALGVDLTDVPQDKYVAIPAVVTMVNARVVKVHLNPLDSGDFPYDVIVWQRQSGKWTGIGVARQIRAAQRIVNGAGRALMDNAGRAAGPMFGYDPDVVEPINGVAEITPWKGWRAKNGVENMGKAFAFFTVPMLQQELISIIQFGLMMAENSTGLPMLMQGQQGSAPETVGGMQLLNNNGGTVLRRIARNSDDSVTEPHIRRYYKYLLQYGDDDSAKGDFQIDARGSSALVERTLQAAELPKLLQASMNPVFKLDPAKVMAEVLKSQRLDVKRFEYDDQQWQQIVQKMAAGLMNPKLAVAQFEAAVEQKKDAAQAQWKSHENALDRETKVLLKRIDERIMAIKTEGAKDINFDALRGDLAKAVMDVNARLKIAGANITNDAQKHVVPKGSMPHVPLGEGEAEPLAGWPQ